MSLDWKTMTTAERIEALRPLSENGMTATQMALHFTNVSRNAIVCFCHRHSLSLSARSIPKEKRKAEKKEPRATPPRPKGNTASKPVRKISQTPTPEMAVPFFVAITHGLCKWPLWGTDETIGDCCGAPRDGDSNYCEHHAARSVGSGTESERTAHRVLEKYA